MTATIARMQRANRGTQFRAYRLHGSDPAQLDPFMGIDHAWMSAPTFPPHPHAGFSAVTYLFLDSETGIANRDSRGHKTLIEPGGLHSRVEVGGDGLHRRHVQAPERGDEEQQGRQAVAVVG